MKTYTLYQTGSTLTIQPKEYIDNGWFIEIEGKEITLYESFSEGATTNTISPHSTLQEAIDAATKLT